ncbi:MAG: hypothetical protein AB7V62_10485 [Thermoleophilia bacterium]
MPASDDPTANAPDAETRRRVGTAVGLAITAVAIVVAVAFGVGRADDPGRVVVGVVNMQERPARGTPDAAQGSGFARRALSQGWLPTGARTDDVEGRTTTTVVWERAGRRIAHTTVSGDPVDAPADARRTGRRGVLLRSFESDGRTAVAWTANGHTEVISAVGVSRAALYDLAGGRPLT